MDLTNLIMTGLPAGTLGQLARQTGVDEATAHKVVGAAVPALGTALGGQAALGNSLGEVPHTAEGLTSPAARQAGGGLLERLLGGSGLAAIAAEVAAKSGTSPAIVQQILPYVAAFLAQSPGTGGGGLGGLLGGAAPGGIVGKLFKG